MDKNCLEHRVVMGIISVPVAEAAVLAEKLVKEKLAACAQVTGGITSYYQWEGKIQKDNEVLIIFKTKEKLQQAAADFIEREHSYEVPECLFIPATGGICSYLRWVGDVTV